ncbi:MAG: terminase small subunit [Clostridia bacterium]|nr:terminase small subunit [Clostridia bacterium]
MSNSEKTLKKKELSFCYHYIETGNAFEAAKLAGYKNNVRSKAIKLLESSKIAKKIEEIYMEKKRNLMYKATSGYERLAFGNICDSIKLLFCENISYKDLEKMDLFNIAEIKKPKEGAMEIKFFDRLRALEKLEEIDTNEKSEKDPFYYALEQGLKKLGNTEPPKEA